MFEDVGWVGKAVYYFLHPYLLRRQWHRFRLMDHRRLLYLKVSESESETSIAIDHVFHLHWQWYRIHRLHHHPYRGPHRRCYLHHYRNSVHPELGSSRWDAYL